MAQYLRFEIYVPVVYAIREKDPASGKERLVRHALSDELLRRLIEDTMEKYGGITQANPLAPASYKGWWKSRKKGAVEVDYLTYLFGLVPVDESDEAKEFFKGWTRRLASAEEQEVILLIYFPVHTIGDFF